MTTLIIRDLDPTVKLRLDRRAAEHGRSAEAEAREILAATLTGDLPMAGKPHIYEAIRSIVKQDGGYDLELPPRDLLRGPPAFE